MNSFFTRLVPFIFIGIMLVVLAIGIILFSYLLILGAIVGLILFLVSVVKEKLFPKPSHPAKRSGRTIDHRND